MTIRPRHDTTRDDTPKTTAVPLGANVRRLCERTGWVPSFGMYGKVMDDAQVVRVLRRQR